MGHTIGSSTVYGLLAVFMADSKDYSLDRSLVNAFCSSSILNTEGIEGLILCIKLFLDAPNRAKPSCTIDSTTRAKVTLRLLKQLDILCNYLKRLFWLYDLTRTTLRL